MDSGYALLDQADAVVGWLDLFDEILRWTDAYGVKRIDQFR